MIPLLPTRTSVGRSCEPAPRGVLLLVCAIGRAVVQEADPPSAAAEATPPPVEALPLSEVSSEAECTSAEILELRTLVAPSEAVTAARNDQLGFESMICDVEQDPAHADPQSFSRAELKSASRQWKRVAGRRGDVFQTRLLGTPFRPE